MSFFDIVQQYEDFSFKQAFEKVSLSDIDEAINSEKKTSRQLICLLSHKCEPYLETLARQAQILSLQHFGRAILLYTPLYLSNYCENHCLYCGFNAGLSIKRKQLSLKEVEKEAEVIAASGLQHLLILTGECRSQTPFSYIKDCLNLLNKYFSSLSIEIYSLSQAEYQELILLGIDGVTIYQEVYDRSAYANLHPQGPKKDYLNRLNTPAIAASCRIRTLNIGALLGLADSRKEVFFALLHAQYLQNKYPDVELSISLPRLRPQIKNFTALNPVSDTNIVQFILAARIFMPRLGITLSTRENRQFRDNLIGLGITKMSAGSSTAVGGHSITEPYEINSSQFEIADQRSVAEMRKAILAKGYEPVLKDWVGKL